MGFTSASCSAYKTIHGVMIPGVSAGSNQVGASVVCTPQVNCPCGPAAAANSGVPATIPKAASAKRSRRVTPAPLPPGDGAPRPPTGDAIAPLHAAPFAKPCPIDPTSREVLDLFVDRVRHLPVLLAITFRPEFQPPWGVAPTS